MISSTMEPNNAAGDESCTVANATEVRGTPLRWGWSDTVCSDSYIFLCRMQGAQQA